MDQDGTDGREPRDGKGKDKGKYLSNEDEDPPTTPGPGSESDSMLSRLATSTSRLTSDLIAHRPDTDYMNDVLTSGKPGPSSPSTSQTAGASVRETSYGSTSAQPIIYENSFKSIHTQEHVTQEETGFSGFLNHVGGLEQTGPRPVGLGQGSWQNDKPRQMPQGALSSTDDGMGVVRLLDSNYDGGAAEEVEIPMTSDERSTLRQALFSGGEKTGEAWEDILNFFPEFISNERNGTACDRISEYLGVSDPEQARDIWINQWQDVLSSYTDEVWGDLGHLVGRAQEELQTLATPQAEKAPPTGLQALRRLQQILAHVRGS